MTHEISAGVIIYNTETKHFLLLHYPSGHWEFPKGHLESKEKPIEAAIRELEEETGIIDVEILDEFNELINYHFKRGSKNINKDVHFFLGLTRINEIKISHEHQDCIWLPFNDAVERVTFKNAKELLKKAEKIINQRT